MQLEIAETKLVLAATDKPQTRRTMPLFTHVHYRLDSIFKPCSVFNCGTGGKKVLEHFSINPVYGLASRSQQLENIIFARVLFYV